MGMYSRKTIIVKYSFIEEERIMMDFKKVKV